MHNRPELGNFQLEQPTTADNGQPAARPPSRLSCRSRHERVRGKPSASLLRCLRPFKAATRGFADGRQRGLSPAPEFSKQEARGPWKGGPRTLSNRGASGRGGLILSRGKATNSFSSQRGRESESFTGRSPFSPGTCLQGKALGALRCAGGTDSKGSRTPTALGRTWRAPRGPPTSGLTYLGGRSARAGAPLCSSLRLSGLWPGSAPPPADWAPPRGARPEQSPAPGRLRGGAWARAAPGRTRSAVHISGCTACTLKTRVPNPAALSRGPAG